MEIVLLIQLPFVAPKKGDYFGLIFVGSTKSDKLIIYTPQEMKRPDKTLAVSVLTSGNTWIQCKLSDQTVAGSQRITLGLNCPNIKYFRAIKVTFTKTTQEPYEICGLSIDNFTV